MKILRITLYLQNRLLTVTQSSEADKNDHDVVKVNSDEAFTTIGNSAGENIGEHVVSEPSSA